MSRRQQLWIRRAELVQRSELLRGRLVEHSRALVPVFSAADQVRDASRWMRQHPWVPATLLGLLVLRRPRRMLRWIWKGWAGWRMVMRLKRSWEGVL